MSEGISRRAFTAGLAATAGLALAGCTPPILTGGGSGKQPRRAPRGPGDRPHPNRPEGVDLMPQIEHIIIYMQENHSYDSYYGALRHHGDGYDFRRGVPTNSNVDPTGAFVPVFHAPDTCQLGRGVSQSWSSTHTQQDGRKMDGFLFDGNTNAMRYWDGSDLPFYYSLATTFPLCDRWFASAPAQTYPNRMYLQAATCQSLITTDIVKALALPPPANGTIWDKLNTFGISWHDYAWDLPDIALYPKLFGANGDKVKTFPDFLRDCHDGTLPSVSIVSPGVNSYTEENPADIQLGEAYSSSIINAVMNSPVWGSTALFFTYDEHGGYYDHVPSPRAIPPDDILPDVAPEPGAPDAWDRYGCRVPGFVISPYAKRHYVSSVVHDHTSILRFIETKFNLGALTKRDANTSNLLDSFDFKSKRPPFIEPPTLAAPGLPATGSVCTPDIPPPPTTADLISGSEVAVHAIASRANAAANARPLTDTQRQRLDYYNQLKASHRVGV